MERGGWYLSEAIGHREYEMSMTKPNVVTRIQAYGKTLVFHNGSYQIEAMSIGDLQVDDCIVFQDGFWPYEDELLRIAPTVQTNSRTFSVVLSAVRNDSEEWGSRVYVGGVTLSGGSQAVRWTQLRDEDGNDALVEADNSSVMISDLSKLEGAIEARSAGDEMDMYTRLLSCGYERVGDAFIVMGGKGVGAYATWVGFDAQDRVAEVVLDLEFFDDGTIQ